MPYPTLFSSAGLTEQGWTRRRWRLHRLPVPHTRRPLSHASSPRRPTPRRRAPALLGCLRAQAGQRHAMAMTPVACLLLVNVLAATMPAAAGGATLTGSVVCDRNSNGIATTCASDRMDTGDIDAGCGADRTAANTRLIRQSLQPEGGK
eukprot:SM000016S01990  [mRNA]  locus=s16:1220513:1221946:+ [translate_table: standard]